MTVSTAPQPVVRAGDRDREKTAALLGRGLTQGYLEMHEYEQRVGAFAARTAAELRAVVAGTELPVSRRDHSSPASASTRYTAGLRNGVRRLHTGVHPLRLSGF